MEESKVVSDISGLGTRPSAEWSVAKVDLPALEMASNKLEVGRERAGGGVLGRSVNKLGAGGQSGRWGRGVAVVVVVVVVEVVEVVGDPGGQIC